MNNTPTPVGSRVRVEHGTGTVRGYENIHHRDITQSYDKPTSHVYRLMVELDPGHTWYFKDTMYFVWEVENRVIIEEDQS